MMMINKIKISRRRQGKHIRPYYVIVVYKSKKSPSRNLTRSGSIIGARYLKCINNIRAKKMIKE